MHKLKILTIGEVVWDIFPDRQVLGGAPLNVAYQLHSQGLEVTPVSRIGADDLGRRTLEEIDRLGLSCRGIQQDPELATGRVTVTIGNNHEPVFNIIAPAAWDAIALDPALTRIEKKPFLLVFGTLAQRSPISRKTIQALRQLATIRCYDVNLRPPFTTPDLVRDSLAAADLVKMNEEELQTVANWFGISGTEPRDLGTGLRNRFAVNILVVTRGAAGAWLLCPDGFFSHPGFPVRVADTVGSGDAFFAGIIKGYLAGRAWPETLARANRRGAYVASSNGATPSMAGLDTS
ncbi:MAG: carbohydrate kinase [Desulfobacterales bacterium]|nr:carbohydrate kinase [Desulfobacterales bacterium]